VSVTLLKRSVAVEIERDWVEPLEKHQRNKFMFHGESALVSPG
jgi:hypothetical protein